MSRHRAVRNLDIDGKTTSCLASRGMTHWFVALDVLEEDTYSDDYDENECKWRSTDKETTQHTYAA